MAFHLGHFTNREEPSHLSLILRGGILLALVAALGFLSVRHLGNDTLMLVVTLAILAGIATSGRFLLRERDTAPPRAKPLARRDEEGTAP